MKKIMTRWSLLLISALILTFLLASSVLAQQASTADLTLTNAINGLNLKPDQKEKTLALVKDFLVQIQTSSTEMLRILSSANPNDPKALNDQKAQYAVTQKEFSLKYEGFKLDLTDIIGEEKAGQLDTVIHNAIPAVLLQQPASSPDPNNSQTANNSMGNMNMSGQNGSSTGAGPNETPLGSTPQTNGAANSNSSSLDLQVQNNSSSSSGGMGNMGGMDSMMGMMGNMMGMGNMNSQNGAMSANPNDEAIKKIIVQLVANNATMIQMLSSIAKDGKNATIQSTLQPVYQMIATQNTLIQMLLTLINSPATNMNGSNSNSSGNMGSMSGGGGGMGMM